MGQKSQGFEEICEEENVHLIQSLYPKASLDQIKQAIRQTSNSVE